MADQDAPPIPDDPRDWAPMRPYQGRRKFDIKDALVEPFWSGARVLAHIVSTPDGEHAAEVTLIEKLGADLSPELPDLTEAIGRAVLVREAIVDGVVTAQIALDGVGAAPIPEVRGSATSLLMRNDVDLDVVPRGTPDETEPAEPRDGFIAFDLLHIDGTSLLDVPLLERKRVLESVVAPSELVRYSAHVRPPLNTWIGTWKAMGLRGGILKAANSRYQPGYDTTEWRIVERMSRG
jgi:ATP-dependent DNA ligase